MIVVLDASGAAEIALNRPKAPRFREVLSDADLVLAPDIFVTEITNVFWKYVRFSGLSASEATQAVDFSIGLVDSFAEARLLWREALAEAVRLSHPVYDLCYAITARRNGAFLMTCDGKLGALCAHLGIATVA